MKKRAIVWGWLLLLSLVMMLSACGAPSLTATATNTATMIPSSTATSTVTPSPTPTDTATVTPSSTATSTVTPSPTPIDTATSVPTPLAKAVLIGGDGAIELLEGLLILNPTETTIYVEPGYIQAMLELANLVPLAPPILIEFTDSSTDIYMVEVIPEFNGNGCSSGTKNFTVKINLQFVRENTQPDLALNLTTGMWIYMVKEYETDPCTTPSQTKAQIYGLGPVSRITGTNYDAFIEGMLHAVAASVGNMSDTEIRNLIKDVVPEEIYKKFPDNNGMAPLVLVEKE